MPHIGQTDFILTADGVRQHGNGVRRKPGWYDGKKLEVSVDNMRFELGYATGDGCNCLIDTLRKLLNDLPSVIIPQGCLPEVRRLLEDKHRHGPTPIRSRDYLDLAHYWEDIVNLLWERDTVHLQLNRTAEYFEIICIDLLDLDHGERLPHDADRSRRRGLYVARLNGNHFVPLERIWDSRVVRPVPPARVEANAATIVPLSEAAL